MNALESHNWVQVAYFSVLALPLMSMVIAQCIPEQNERAIHRAVLGAALLQMVVTMVGVSAWLLHGGHPINVPEWELYGSDTYVFLIDLYFDGDSAAFLVVGSLLYALIIRYSSAYLHREAGYRR